MMRDMATPHARPRDSARPSVGSPCMGANGLPSIALVGESAAKQCSLRGVNSCRLPQRGGTREVDASSVYVNCPDLVRKAQVRLCVRDRHRLGKALIPLESGWQLKRCLISTQKWYSCVHAPTDHGGEGGKSFLNRWI